MESSAKGALSETGYPGTVSAEIVTLIWRGGSGYDVCLDNSRRGQDGLELIAELERRAKANWLAHPRRDIVHSHRELHERQQENLDKSSRGRAICDILSDIESGRRVFFDAYPASVDGKNEVVDGKNEVFVIVG